MRAAKLIEAAKQVIVSLGLPRAQQNERSALVLLALLDLAPGSKWIDAKPQSIGITPVMDWLREKYGKDYAPNTRETIRRQTMHQFVAAGIAILNSDDPKRPPNSPNYVYEIEPSTLKLLRSYGSRQWHENLTEYQSTRQTLAARYAKERHQNLVPVQLADGKNIKLGPGEHSELIKAIIEEFGARYVSGGKLIYVGDTSEKWGYLDAVLLAELGVQVDSHGKMPDVVLYDPEHNWLLLIESVTSHGPVDGKRHDELSELFGSSKSGLVYVTAFPNRSVMARYLGDISWETEVWVADSPSHLIHFNGERFLGPYASKEPVL